MENNSIVRVHLVGICLTEKNLERILVKQGLCDRNKLFHMHDKEKALYSILKEHDSFLIYVMAFWNKEFYLGRDIYTIKDEETIGEIKEEVEEEIKRIFHQLVYCLEPCEFIIETFDFTYQEKMANM